MFQFLSFQILLREPIPQVEKENIVKNIFESSILAGSVRYHWTQCVSDTLKKDGQVHTLACFKMELSSCLDVSPIIAILMDRVAVLRNRFKNDVQLSHLVQLNGCPVLKDDPTLPPGLSQMDSNDQEYQRTTTPIVSRQASAELPVLFEEDEPKVFESKVMAVWQPLTRPIIKSFADPFAEAAVKTSVKQGVKRAVMCLLENNIKTILEMGVKAGMLVGKDVGVSSLLQVSVDATVEAIVKASVETAVKVAVEAGAKSLFDTGLKCESVSAVALKAFLEADVKSAIEVGLSEVLRKQNTPSPANFVQINDFRSGTDSRFGRRSRGRHSRRTPSPLVSEFSS